MMTLTHVCILTDNVKRLSDFYRDVLAIKPRWFGDEYVEFRTEDGILSLFSAAAHKELVPGVVKVGANSALELEFKVDDVDEEYERLRNMDIEWVMEPTTLPWGNRSIYLRDPDGNLINLYTQLEVVAKL